MPITALKLGEKDGFRNAQVTAIAPTGTIGLLMDCDTTGIEPDFALVKFKKLAGGGYFKIINNSIPPALYKLGYEDTRKSQTLCTISRVTHDWTEVRASMQTSLRTKGFTSDVLERIERTIANSI